MLWTAWTTGGLHHRRLVVPVVMIWPVVLALETRAPQSASERARRKRYVARSGVRSLPVVRDVSNGCGWLYDVTSQAVLQAAVTAVTKIKSQAIQRRLPGSAPLLKLGSTSKPGVLPRDRNSMLALGHALAQYVVWCRCSCGGTPRWTLTRSRAEIACESSRRPPSSRRSHSCTSLCRCSMGSVQATGSHSRCPKPNPGWRTRMA